MKTKFLLLVVALLSVFPEYFLANPPSTKEAFISNISGKVVDSSTGSPLEYVSVAVYKSADSVLVAGMVSDDKGNFKISDIDNGDYYLKFSYVGFEKKQSSNISISGKSRKTDLGNIALEPASTGINEVVVSAEKSRVEYKIDKRVINVDKELSARGGTAVNVLENTPSVQVDPQGNVTLRGSSDFIVLIDGKPSVLKGSDALKQLPSSAIKQIEVITNPSAKYDAEGQAGIINVVLKKEKLQGVNGSINASAGSTKRNTANVLANYRQGKFNYFGGIDFADNKYSSDLNIDNVTMLSADHQYTHQFSNQFNYNKNLTYKAGIDFDPNEKNSFTFSGSYGNQGYDNGTDSRYHKWNLSESENRFNTSRNLMIVDGEVIGLNADYKYTFNENQSLSFTNSYSSWGGLDDNNLNELNTDANFNYNSTASKLNFTKDNYNYNYRANLDYKQPLFSGTFETGVQFRYENRYEDLLFRNFNVNNSTWTDNDTFSYNLDYLNTIYSGYATYSGTVFGIGYQLGLRSEYFMRSIGISSEKAPIDYNKFMFYPSLHFSKDFNGKHQLQLSYSRRINRPQPWLLNNTPSYVDPYNIFKGSPYLIPEYTDAYEFNYRTTLGKFTFSTQTYYRNTINSFQALRLMNDKGIMYHQLTNSESQQAYGIEQGIDVNLFKWWSINSGANIYRYQLTTLISSSEKKTQKVNTWDARFINNFNLKWDIRIQTVAYYRAPGVDAQGESQGFFTSNLAISKTLLKGKGNLGVSVENVFNSIKFDYKVQSSSFNNNYNIVAEGPIVMLNFSYAFNNFQNKNRGRADDTSFKGGGAF